MGLGDWIAVAGVLVGIIFGIPAWLAYRNDRSKKRDLENRMAAFFQAFQGDIRARRLQLGYDMTRLAGAISPGTRAEDVASWETTGRVPLESLGQLLDVLGVSDLEYRTLGLRFLSSEEFSRYVEPGNHRWEAEADMAVARRTWAIGGRYVATTIPVVAAQSQSKSQFRVRSSPNHVYLDGLSDRDSIVELVGLLSRLFPFSVVSLECSAEYPRSLKDRPSIILGGVGFPGRPNNEFGLETFSALKVPIEHSDTSLSMGRRIWKSELKDGLLIRDTGLFARVHSPLDRNVALFLIQGTHTLGVYGAAQAFSLSRRAVANHKLVANNVGDEDFVAVFDVDIVGGRVAIPELKGADLFTLADLQLKGKSDSS